MKEETSAVCWWQTAIFYHIYPQSFYDTNSDGIGDLEGIRQKLPYLQKLGIDAIWLSPIYLSPLIDEGYDISDYTAIHPRYGTIDDFVRLLQEIHERNMYLVIDLVLNHTSDRHPWFMASASSVANEKRDWYLWHPGKRDGKPNNWFTNFGRSAWKKEKRSGEYYYHSFFPEQPDLNWRNPDVKRAMFKMIRFWLELGVDGFRLDVANLLFKHADFPDNPLWSLFSDRKVYNRNQSDTYELLKEFRILLNSYGRRVSIGEIYVSPPGNSRLAASFTGNGENMLHMVFDFSLFFTRWGADSFYKVINRYYQSLPAQGWPCFVFSNHDLGRAVSHYFVPVRREKKAKLLATLLLTLWGTPFVYYGDEIGMRNSHVPRSRMRDRYGMMFYPFFKGRDRSRTPMQWNSDLHAGFSEVLPWLPVDRDYKNHNVAVMQEQESSVWRHYQRLISLRRCYPALQTGKIEFLNQGKEGYLVYKRCDTSHTFWIIINFTPFKRIIKKKFGIGELFIKYTNSRRNRNQPVTFPFSIYPYETVIIGDFV